MKSQVKISICFFLSPLLGLFFCHSSFSQDPPTTLTVLSYNIHYGVGMDGHKDLERIAKVIKQLNPDIVGLQEVADSRMTARLAQLTQMQGVFGASTEIEPPNLYKLLGIPVPEAQLFYGDAILSRYPFKYIGNVSIPSASSSRYEAMCVEVDVSERFGANTTLGFITTHFDYLNTIGSKAARKVSVEVIEKAFIEERANIPYILTGDLNATPGSEPLQELARQGWYWQDFGKALFTVPVSSPQKQIDYVLVRPREDWEIEEVRVIQEKMASDHFPILMKLQLNK